LHKSRTEYDELKSQYNDVVIERETLSMEHTDCRARYEQTCAELRRVKESAETERYHALDEERVKWERREATLYAQLERARTTESGASIGVHPLPPDATPSSVLSPKVSRSLSQKLPRVPDGTPLSSASCCASTSLRVMASDFSQAITARLSIGGITSSVYTPPSRLAGISDESRFVCSSSSSVLTATSTSMIPMRSSPSIGLPVTTASVLSPLSTFARLLMSGVSAPIVHPTTNQLPPICKFKGEDPDQEGGNFEEWIEQFELIAEAYGWDPRAKLVNLTTRLQGQAYTFY